MTDIQAVTDTSEYKKPYYTVQISYAGTGAEFRLNDIPFYLENYDGQVDVEISVSNKIVQGVNELSIIAFTYIDGDDPVENWSDSARIEASLYVREKEAAKDTRKILTNIKLYPARKPDVAVAESLVFNGQGPVSLDYKSMPRKFPDIVYKKQIVANRKTHNIKTPFPQWEWQQGQTIEATPQNFSSLLEAYRKYYIVHQRKDLATLKTGYKNVAIKQQLVNYFKTIEEAYDLLDLGQSWDDTNQELFEFLEGESLKEFGLKFDVIANGKLARLTNEEDIQPILYVIPDQEMTIKYNFMFYKNKNDKWELVM